MLLFYAQWMTSSWRHWMIKVFWGVLIKRSDRSRILWCLNILANNFRDPQNFKILKSKINTPIISTNPFKNQFYLIFYKNPFAFIKSQLHLTKLPKTNASRKKNLNKPLRQTIKILSKLKQINQYRLETRKQVEVGAEAWRKIRSTWYMKVHERHDNLG